VTAEGQPIQPTPAVTKYVNYCGRLVREFVGINRHRWRGDEDGNGQVVPENQKQLLWKELTQKFTFTDGINVAKVKEWTMKKMGELFRSHRKKLYSKYVKEGKTPDFKVYPKLRDHWEAFVQYKTSEEVANASAKNKENAARKQYHHRLGAGGYKKKAESWLQREDDLLQQGIIPMAHDWPERSKRWWLGHGGSFADDGSLIYPDAIRTPTERLITAIDQREKGVFSPDREKDELTLALQNPEHPGRTRGYGTVPWKLGFPQYVDSYRSRQRRKAEEDARFQDRISTEVARQVQIAIASLSQQSGLPPTAADVASPSLRKSSCASTEHPNVSDKQYPVDEIDVSKPCELHIPIKNKSLRVAHGMALPVQARPTFHGSEVPAGYSTVSVEEVVAGYEDLELDHPGGEGEKTLGEAVHAMILWDKRYIIFSGGQEGPTAPSMSPPPGASPRHSSPPPAPRRSPTPPPRKSLTPVSSPRRSPTPTQPPAKRQRATKSTAKSMSSRSQSRSTSRSSRSAKSPEKLPYELTEEETAVVVAADVKSWKDSVRLAAREGSKKKEPLNQRTKDLLTRLSDVAHPKPIPDYERSVRKSYAKRNVPQLGCQRQSPITCPPVDNPELTPDMLRSIAETGLTVDQYFGRTSVEAATVRQPFKYGQPFVQPHLVPKLSTQMRRFHEWYLKESAKGRQMVGVLIKDMDYFRGPDVMYLDFQDIYEIYHRDALDASLISCWVL
jgi:hypothetical protein